MIRKPSKYICGIFEKKLALESKFHTKKNPRKKASKASPLNDK
jgi:hypothetical protein